MGLEQLTPEEKQTLYEALQAELGGGEVCECDAKFDQVAEVLKGLAAEMALIKETLFDKLIGGIQSLYNDNMRTTGIAGMKEKYGSLFDPYMDAFGEMFPGADLWSSLYDEQEGMRGGEGWSDEAGDARIKQRADELKSKVEKIRGPVAAKVEVATPAPVAEADVDPMTAIVDRVKKLKKGRAPGIAPGA